MPGSLTQRIDPNTQLIYYREGTRGSDSGITAGFVVPLRDVSGFQITRPETEAPYFHGNIQGWDTVPGLVSGAGSVPCGLEFTTSGNFLKMPFGTAGYSRVALVTGSVHSFFPSSSVVTALTAQLQAESLETTALYERARYVMLQSLASSYASSGAAPLDLTFIGNGDVVQTDLAGSKTDNGYGAVSVYNGQARLAVSALAPTWFVVQPTAFNFRLDTGAARQEAAFNDGVAVAVNQGVPMLKGSLALAMAVGGATPESDFTYLNYAINRNVMSYECVWCDATFGASPFPSNLMMLKIASMRIGRQSSLRPGGRAALTAPQPWGHILHSTYSKVAAESWGTVVGTYNIATGVNDIVSHNIDGLGASSVTLSNNAATTAASVVSQLNANGTFIARATADVLGGRVRVTSKQTGGTGLSSSVAFTAAANNANATLGLNTTSITGFNAPYVFKIWNQQNSDYA